MSRLPRHRSLPLLLVLLVAASAVGIGVAAGETSGSSWSDPPARDSAAPSNPSPVTRKASKPAEENKAPASAESSPAHQSKTAESAKTNGALQTPAQRAEAKLGVKSFRAGKGSRARRVVVRPRMVEPPLVLARRSRRVIGSSKSRVAHRYTYTARPRNRVARLTHRHYAAAQSRRRLAGWGGLVGAGAAARAARYRPVVMWPGDRDDFGGDVMPFNFDRFGDLD